MIFQPELAAKVLAGEKTVTRRATSPNPRSPWYALRCGLVVGRDYAICPGRGVRAIGRIVVDAVDRRPLEAINNQDAMREGFSDIAEFRATWESINGPWDDLLPVWRIAFHVVEGTP